jgi:hypothetical protein
MNLAAVIQRREHLTIRNSAEFVAMIYDKDRPRDPEADHPCARYAFVDLIGPFRSAHAARAAAEASIEAGRVIHPERKPRRARAAQAPAAAAAGRPRTAPRSPRSRC